MRSLTTKFTLILILASLSSIILIAVLVRLRVANTFDEYVLAQNRQAFADEMLAYYLENQSWQGVENLIGGPGPHSSGVPPRPGQGRGGGGGGNLPQDSPQARFALADANGFILIPFDTYGRGKNLSERDKDESLPITIDDVVVGYVITTEHSLVRDPDEDRFLARTNDTLVLVAGIASVLAVVFGVILARLYTRPLRELTRAVRNISQSQGEIEQRVTVTTRDELGVLAHEFNHMSQQLAQSRQTQKQMSADIAHDLRTPLSVIAGYFEAFQDGVLQPTSDRISTLNQEVILLQRLVEDLRTLSLSDMGRLSLHPERVGVQELMEQVYQRFLHQAQRQNIALRKEIQTEQTLVVDVSYTRRIFDNLIENAIRHTPQGGTITLSAKQVEETVCFTIADTGPGIPPDKLPRIFDRFYRVDPTRKQNGNETGLGLAIAKALVELHHGTIEVDSALGQGAKFTVSLPVMHPKIWTQKSGL